MFMADVSIIVRKMRTYAERKQAGAGIGFPEQLVLMHLKARGDSNQEAIATSLDIDKGAVAKTVAKLEEKGLVTRTVNEKNRREKKVALQPVSDGLLEDMASDYQKFEKIMFEGISPEELKVMQGCIARIARNVSEI